MKRYKITLQYIGTKFSGWQKQKNALSIQEVMEQTLFQILKHSVIIYVAGRTDKGVHAMNQVAHFQTNVPIDCANIVKSLNFFIRPHEILILEVEEVSVNFHARFSCKSRSYIYKILNNMSGDIFYKNLAWHIRAPLNAELMNEAAQVLIGTHDLSSFRSANCQASSPIRTINIITVKQIGDIIEIFIQAPSFLYNQVRIIVGCLKQIGTQVWEKEDLLNILKAKERTKASITAPACGLYLYKVEY